MAIMPLREPIEWGYDNTTGQLVVRMQEQAPDGDADWVPTREAIVRLNIANVNVNDL